MDAQVKAKLIKETEHAEQLDLFANPQPTDKITNGGEADVRISEQWSPNELHDVQAEAEQIAESKKLVNSQAEKTADALNTLIDKQAETGFRENVEQAPENHTEREQDKVNVKSKGKKKNVRGRPKGRPAHEPGDRIRGYNWQFIIYPESAPKDWRDKLEATHLRIFAILHDNEPDRDNSTDDNIIFKKAHIHIIVRFDSLKSRAQVKEIFADVLVNNNLNVEKINSIIGASRYLIHKDDPDKVQYKIEDVIQIHCADYAEVIVRPVKKSNGSEITRDVCALMKEMKLFDIDILMTHLWKNKPEWAKQICNCAANQRIVFGIMEVYAKKRDKKILLGLDPDEDDTPTQSEASQESAARQTPDLDITPLSPDQLSHGIPKNIACQIYGDFNNKSNFVQAINALKIRRRDLEINPPFLTIRQAFQILDKIDHSLAMPYDFSFLTLKPMFTSEAYDENDFNAAHGIQELLNSNQDFAKAMLATVAQHSNIIRRHLEAIINNPADKEKLLKGQSSASQENLTNQFLEFDKDDFYSIVHYQKFESEVFAFGGAR